MADQQGQQFFVADLNGPGQGGWVTLAAPNTGGQFVPGIGNIVPQNLVGFGQQPQATSQQQPNAPAFLPGGVDPNQSTLNLGAAALGQQAVYNPTPGAGGIGIAGSQFGKSGVNPVAMPTQSTSVPQAPVGPWTNLPSGSLFSKNVQLAPTAGGIPQPTPYGGGMAYEPGRAFARAPMPPGATVGQPPPAIPPTPMTGPMTPSPTQMQFPGAMGIAPSAPGNGPISGLSPTATPPGPPSLAGANAVKHMAGGGQVQQGNTDTVPAMLTPGEYVINRNAAEQIGRGRLDQLNAEGRSPIHMQGGGDVPGALSASQSYSLGADPQNPNTSSNDAQSWAFGQLSPPEQALLRTGNSVAQQKYNQLVNSYQRSSGSPTPMWAQAGGANPAMAAQMSVRRPQAPAAPAGQGQAQANPAYSGSLDQWLAQYGHTPQGQAYIGQNANVNEVQRYLKNLTTPQTGPAPGSPLYGNPNAMQVGPPNPTQSGGSPYVAGGVIGPQGSFTGGGIASAAPSLGIGGTAGTAGGIGNMQKMQMGTGLISSAAHVGDALKNLQTTSRPIQSAIPDPSYYKSQTPDLVLQGHQVGKPEVPGGYVLMAQPHDQAREEDNTGYPQSPYGVNLS